MLLISIVMNQDFIIGGREIVQIYRGFGDGKFAFSYESNRLPINQHKSLECAAVRDVVGRFDVLAATDEDLSCYMNGIILLTCQTPIPTVITTM